MMKILELRLTNFAQKVADMYLVEQYLVGKMEKEMKETVLQAVEYTNTEAEKNNNRVRVCYIIAMILIVANIFLRDTSIYNENSIVMAATDFAEGLAIGVLLVCVIMLSRYGARIKAFKQRIFKKKC